MRGGFKFTFVMGDRVESGRLFTRTSKQKGELMKTVITGDLVRFSGDLYEVTSVWDTNLPSSEGLRVNISRSRDDGTLDRRTVPIDEVERID